MKKLLLNLFAFLFGVILLFFFSIAFFIKIRPQFFLGAERNDYNRVNYKYNIIKNDSNLKNIIVGDSKGAVDIAPLLLGKDWFNLSLDGSNFFEAFISLKYLLKRNKIDTVLMCYDIKSDIEGIHSRMNDETVPFQFVNYPELLNLEKVETKEGRLINDGYNFPTSFLGTKLITDKDYLVDKQYLRRLSYFHFPFSYRETFLDGLFNLILGFHNKKQDDLNSESLKKNLGQFQLGTDDCYKGGDQIPNLNKEFNPNVVNLAYLDSIVRISKEANITILLIPAPINVETNKNFLNSIYKSSWTKFTDKIKVQFPNLIFLSTNPTCIPDSCFGDGGHTNLNGTTFFSNIIKTKLEVLKIAGINKNN